MGGGLTDAHVPHPTAAHGYEGAMRTEPYVAVSTLLFLFAAEPAYAT